MSATSASTSEIVSPFAPLLSDCTVCLPAPFREQFLLSPEDRHAVVFEGRMDRVWRRPAWLWPCFWLATFSQTLFPETGEAVPATMVITADRDREGRPRQRWDRTFSFAVPRQFNATMGYDPEQHRVMERFGRSQSLEIAWQVRYHPPDTIAIDARGAALLLGRRRLPIPRPFCFAVRAIERADLRYDDRISIDLRLTVPLLGAVFGYCGIFRVRRVARD